MISRIALRNSMQHKLETNRVVALIGPRQCGKTTIARQFVAPTSPNYFDLEDPFSLARLDQPMTTLQDLQGLVEIGAQAQNLHWRRGVYPLCFTAPTEETSLEWRKDFVRTFLERDIPQFGFNIHSTSLFRFWSLLAHYLGQIWNVAEAGCTLNIGETTARRYWVEE
jgi:predicted AAA+ superfamily ATPase